MKKTTTTTPQRVRLKLFSDSLESVHEPVEPFVRPQDFRELSRVARDAKAERDLEKMGFSGR